MKYLITGGAGFIGSHLAERLIAEGETVHIIDNLSTGSIENIDSIRNHPRLHCIIDTITNEPLLAEMIDRCDVIFHLAAAVGVRLVVERPVETIETNIHGTELVLRHAAKKKKKVLIASTSEVYGKAAPSSDSSIGLREDDDMHLGPTIHSRWCYACSKAIDEFLALAYGREEGLPVIIARLFNTVGPRQVGRYGMVLPRFVEQALAGGPITVYDDGRMVRCFAHVADVVDALLKLVHHPAAVQQVFNVGSDEPVTILQLAERVRQKVNPALKIEFIPFSKAYGEGFEDIRWRVPDLSKIRNVIGYRPTRSLDQIISDVIAHFRKRQSA